MSLLPLMGRHLRTERVAPAECGRSSRVRLGTRRACPRGTQWVEAFRGTQARRVRTSDCPIPGPCVVKNSQSARRSWAKQENTLWLSVPLLRLLKSHRGSASRTKPSSPCTPEADIVSNISYTSKNQKGLGMFLQKPNPRITVCRTPGRKHLKQWWGAFTKWARK